MSRSSRMKAIVIGAGPAGFGAAIGLAQCGCEVTVLEKQETLGSQRRGETIRADTHMERILGRGFFEKIAIRKVNQRRYFSHTGLSWVERSIQNPNIIFSWPELIKELSRKADEFGVKVLTGTEVRSFIRNSGKVRGVVAENNNKEDEYPSDCVFSCGGCQDPAAAYIGQDRNGIDMAAAKRLVTEYSGQDWQLEYHFHIKPEGMVIGVMFPRGNGEAEFILMDTSAGSISPPSFENFMQEHPRFRRLMEGTRTYYELKTMIPMGGVLKPFSPIAGLIMAGDAMGHVQSRGGSGIKTSFLIGHSGGAFAAKIMDSGGWTEDKRVLFEKHMNNDRHVRELRHHNLIYGNLRPRIFKWIRSPADMDMKWPLLKIALR